MAKVNPIPTGSHTITAGLVVKGGKKAIEFYKKAFGAKELGTMYGPDGQLVMHSELKIGDTKFYVSDEALSMGEKSPTTLGGSPTSLNIYTEDCDTTFKTAIAAGATSKTPPTDMFWGDRYGKLTDPFGHNWGIATHKEDVSKEDMEKRAKEAMTSMPRK